MSLTKMSRLDDFEEILNSCEGRKYDKHMIPELDVSINVRDLFEKVSSTDSNRHGYLLGKMERSKIIVEDIVLSDETFGDKLADSSKFPPFEKFKNIVGLTSYIVHHFLGQYDLQIQFVIDKFEHLPKLQLILNKQGEFCVKRDDTEYKGDIHEQAR